MSKSFIIESVALYWPIVLSIVLYYYLRMHTDVDVKRPLTAGMMASVWVAATLPWINDLCVAAGYWNFKVDHTYILKTLPLSLYLGWVVFWGMLPALILPYIGYRAWLIVLVFLLVDLFSMGLFEPVMTLTPWSWFIGEIWVVLISLSPAVYLSKWVILQKRVAWRASLVSIAFILLLLWVIPSSIAKFRIEFITLWSSYSLVAQCFWSLILVLVSLPGANGVMEFVRVGKGTPIPYDPPKNLVITGAYAYVRNPMQLSMILVLLVWAYIFSSWFVAGLAVIALVYSIGIARWSEIEDLTKRYGEEWLEYQNEVKAWKMRLTPLCLSKEPARIYVDADCVVCVPIGNWLSQQRLTTLAIYPADQWGDSGAENVNHPLKRITYYDPNQKEVLSGVPAMARAFGHIHIAWAFLGWFIMFPGLCWLIQCAIDVGGGGELTKKK